MTPWFEDPVSIPSCASAQSGHLGKDGAKEDLYSSYSYQNISNLIFCFLYLFAVFAPGMNLWPWPLLPTNKYREYRAGSAANLGLTYTFKEL